MLLDPLTHTPITRRDIRREIRIIRKRIRDTRNVNLQSIYYRRIVRLTRMLRQASA